MQTHDNRLRWSDWRHTRFLDLEFSVDVRPYRNHLQNTLYRCTISVDGRILSRSRDYTTVRGAHGWAQRQLDESLRSGMAREMVEADRDPYADLSADDRHEMNAYIDALAAA